MKKLKQVYIVDAIILFIFIVYLLINIKRFIEIYELTGNAINLNSIYTTISNYGVFKLSLLFGVPVIGVFYRSRLTWVISLIFFYFILWHFFAYTFFEVNFNGVYKIQDVLIIITIYIIPILSIYILNRVLTFKYIFEVDKKSVVLYNLLAFIIGCVISMFVVIISNSQYYESLEF